MVALISVADSGSLEGGFWYIIARSAREIFEATPTFD